MTVLGEDLEDGEGVYRGSLGATIGCCRKVIFSGGAHYSSNSKGISDVGSFI